MALGVRAPTAPAAVATLSPAKACRAPGERQILDPDDRTLLDLEVPRAAVGAALSSLQGLHIHLEGVAVLHVHARDPQPDQPEGSGKFVRHPPSLLAPRP